MYYFAFKIGTPIFRFYSEAQGKYFLLKISKTKPSPLDKIDDCACTFAVFIVLFKQSWYNFGIILSDSQLFQKESSLSLLLISFEMTEKWRKLKSSNLIEFEHLHCASNLIGFEFQIYCRFADSAAFVFVSEPKRGRRGLLLNLQASQL